VDGWESREERRQTGTPRTCGVALFEGRQLCGGGGMDEKLAMAMAAAAASSECSSGCQSGWTTYLDDHTSSYSCGTARFSGKPCQPYYCEYYSEEDDLSMISDASSGPRQHSSAGNDVEGGAAAAHANAERKGRREETAAAARRQKNKRAAAAAAAASSLLEDTASSPPFFVYSKVGWVVARGVPLPTRCAYASCLQSHLCPS
jgi:hypothetical protein